MNRLYRLPMLALLALSFVAVGCDSGDDTPTDASLFAGGTFTVSKLEDNVGTATQRDLTSAIVCATANAGPTQTNPCTVNSIKLTFNANNSYTIAVDYTNTVNAIPASSGGRADVTISGTSYTVNENAKTLSLVIPGTTPITAQGTYTITEAGAVTLVVPSIVFNNIFATTTYQGQVRITMQK